MPITTVHTETWWMPGPVWISDGDVIYVSDSMNTRMKRFNGGLNFIDAYDICPNDDMPDPYVFASMSYVEGIVTLGSKCFIAATPVDGSKTPGVQVWTLGDPEASVMTFVKEVPVPGMCGRNYGGSNSYKFGPSPIGVWNEMICVAHWDVDVQYSVKISMYNAGMGKIRTYTIPGPDGMFITHLPLGAIIK